MIPTLYTYPSFLLPKNTTASPDTTINRIMAPTIRMTSNEILLPLLVGVSLPATPGVGGDTVATVDSCMHGMRWTYKC